MKVILLPKASNPYQYLLGQALNELGVVVRYESVMPTFRWLLARRGERAVFHFHWLNMLYRTVGEPPRRVLQRLRLRLGLVRRVTVLALKLLVARVLGYRIIWTMHNLMPHDSQFYPWIDAAIRYAMMALAHTLIVHCDYARLEARRRFGRHNNVRVIPHGNYISKYPSPMPQREARARMAIDPDAFVYLFFGKIRPYKQLGSLIEVFEKVKHDSSLVIAGPCEDNGLRDFLLDRSRGSERIHLLLEFIPTEQVPVLFGAADVLVAPFSRILTSGSVILSLSLGCPVIAPALGCLPELINADVGILYDPTDAEALPRAMREARMWDLAAMSEEARALALELDWQSISKETLDVYCGG